MPLTPLTLTLKNQILDLIPGLVSVYSVKTGRYIYINQAITKILGYSPAEVLEKGMPLIASLVHPGDAERVWDRNREAIERANSQVHSSLDKEPIISFEYRMKHKNGSWVWLLSEGSVFKRDSEGKVDYVLNISVDITERKKIEQNLIVNNEQLRKAQEVVQKQKQRFFKTALQAEITSALTKEQSVTDMLQKFTDAITKHMPAVLARIWLLNEETGVLELQASSKNSYEGDLGPTPLGKFKISQIAKEKCVFISNNVLTDCEAKNFTWLRKNKINAFIGCPLLVRTKLVGVISLFSREELDMEVQDTLCSIATTLAQGIERIRAEERLHFLAATAHSIADAVIATDLNYQITSWNKGAQELYGWKSSEVLGKKVREVLKTEAPSLQSLDGQLKAFEFWRGEVIQTKKDGSKAHVLSSISLVRDINGKAIGTVGVNRDITQRKQLERQKDEFLAIASHELKTPITSLKGFSEILKMSTHEEKANAYLQKMDFQINRLTSLVNDLLDVSSIESGKMQLNKEVFNLSDLLKDVVDGISQNLQNHKIIFEKLEPLFIKADKIRIGQVLINLILNAVKYSPRAKEIVVKAAPIDNEVMVSVKDYGIGISKQLQQRIFERFYQISNKIRPSFSGLGLGLYISKEIIRAHQGKIGVVSEKGQGSTFYVILDRHFYS